MIAIDYWTPVNPSNKWPYVWYEAAENGLENQYILQFADGSFAKVKHITLSYKFPSGIANKMLLNNLEVYGSVKNPFLLYTKLEEGLDPERNGSDNYPLSRLILFGINVEF